MAVRRDGWWMLGGGLAGLFASALIVAADKLWFKGGAPLRTAGLAAALALAGALVGILVRRRRAARR